MYSKISLAGLAILLIVLIHPTWKIFQKSLESKSNLKRAEAELSDLEARKERLEGDVAYLNTEHGRDQEIRNKFGVALQGETMVVIVRDQSEKGQTEAVPPPGFFGRIWSGFLGIFGID